jgi:tetratricopeptide (TPR) repeat protein
MKRRQGLGNHSWLGIVFFIGMGLLSARAAADSEELARKHAAKANQLAARNQCKRAIFEFTRAYQTLKDPTLLFNRAECFRKVGRNDEAVTDYERFLAELPQTPNRAAVEARIASLRPARRSTSAGQEQPSAPGVKPAAAPLPAKPAERASAPAPAGVAKPTPFSDTKPVEKSGPAPSLAPPPASKAEEKPGEAPTPAPAPPSKAADRPASTATERPAAPAAPAARPAEKAPAAPVRRAERWTD